LLIISSPIRINGRRCPRSCKFLPVLPSNRAVESRYAQKIPILQWLTRRPKVAQSATERALAGSAKIRAGAAEFWDIPDASLRFDVGRSLDRAGLGDRPGSQASKEPGAPLRLTLGSLAQARPRWPGLDVRRWRASNRRRPPTASHAGSRPGGTCANDAGGSKESHMIKIAGVTRGSRPIRRSWAGNHASRGPAFRST
jgi:hypothetical protein